MAVAFVSVGTASGVTGTTDTDVAPSIPSGSTGDLLVAAIQHNGATRYGTASGWDRLTNGNFTFLYRIADGSEGSSVTIAMQTTFSYASSVVLRFSGATVSGIAIGTETVTSTWNSTVDLPTVTASAGGGLIWAGLVSDARNTSSCSRAGATERYDARVDANSWSQWVWTEDDTAAGSVSGATLTLGAAINAKYGSALVIPAAADATGHPAFRRFGRSPIGVSGVRIY
jgi:hypothetical protein